MLEWLDNYTPLSTEYDDVYYSRDDGLAEAQHVFIEKNNLPAAWLNQEIFSIAELGFGTGLNFLLTLKHWQETRNETQRLNYLSFEKHPLEPEQVEKAMQKWPSIKDELNILLKHYYQPSPGLHRINLDALKCSLTLAIGDANDLLPEVVGKADAWFFDGFNPAKNPELWSQQLMLEVAKHSYKSATFATFTCARLVKDNLQAAGFEIHKAPGFGKKREMLFGKLPSGETKKEHPPKSIAVIGGGISGAATAYSLAKRGSKVHLIEREEELANKASGNPVGIIMPHMSIKPDARNNFAIASFNYAIDLVKNINQSNTIPFEQSGVVRLITNDRFERIYEESSDSYPANLVKKDSYTGKNCLVFPRAAWVSPKDFCQQLTNAHEDNIELHLETDAIRLKKEDNKWLVFSEQKQICSADVVILANAYDAENFQNLKWLPFQVTRGQLLVIKANEATNRISSTVCYDGYITPALNGTHTVGATYDREDFSLEERPEETKELINNLLENIEFLSRNDIEILNTRVSLRAGMEDKLSCIGQVPKVDDFENAYSSRESRKSPLDFPDFCYEENLYLNTGHGSLGLSCAPLGAELIASSIFEEFLPIEKSLIDFVHPARFIIRNMRRGIKTE